jgi:hypothetical protein
MDTKELSQKIYDIVVDEVDALYPQFMKRVNDIDIDYFEDITRDSEEMPVELNFELRDKVLDNVRQYAMQLLEGSNIRSRIEYLTKVIDAATIKEAFGNAKQMLRSYVYASSFLNGGSDITEEELQELYTDAKKRDLWELITQNNKKDVVEFQHALMNKTYEQCKDVLYNSIESYLFDNVRDC